MSNENSILSTIKSRRFIPLIFGVLVGAAVGFLIVDLSRLIKFFAASLVILTACYLIAYRNYSVTQNMVANFPLHFIPKRYSDLKEKMSAPNLVWHSLIFISCGLIGYGFAWGNNVLMIGPAAIWWLADSGLNRNYELSLLEIQPTMMQKNQDAL